MENKFEKEIRYAGETARLVFVYDEREQPNWSSIAQESINAERKAGNEACCIHKGFEHGYYVAIMQKVEQ